MKRVIIAAIAVMCISINCYSQQDEKQVGKGNGTFVPDITNTTNLMSKVFDRPAFENLLPNFTLVGYTESHEYNKRTMKHDSLVGYTAFYDFVYKGQYRVDLICSIDLSGNIKQMLFEYYQTPFYDMNKQLMQNGYVYNSKTSDLATKLSFGTVKKFYNKGKLTIVLEGTKKFSISK